MTDLHIHQTDNVETLAKIIEEANRIWIIGNGGSAATADHLATDLIKLGYPAVSLCSNGAVLSMLANDVGFKHVFEYQIAALADEGDLVIAISASGDSKNIVEGLAMARHLGVHCVLIAGKENARASEFADIVFYTNTDGNPGPTESAHLVLVHDVAEYLGAE